MIIGFWSPFHGQCGTTSAMIACGALHGLKGTDKILLAESYVGHTSLEEVLLRKRDDEKNLMGTADMGMKALVRLAKNGRLHADMVHQYTVGLLKESRLDLLTGNMEENQDALSKHFDWYAMIYEYASCYYDTIYVDIHSGLTDQRAVQLMGCVDYLVICLNQNHRVLDAYMSMKEQIEAINPCGKSFLINPYYEGVKATKYNIGRQFNIKKLWHIPFSGDYLSAINQWDAIGYLMRHSKTVGRKGRERDKFVEHVEIFVEHLQSLKEMKPKDRIKSR